MSIAMAIQNQLQKMYDKCKCKHVRGYDRGTRTSAYSSWNNHFQENIKTLRLVTTSLFVV